LQDKKSKATEGVSSVWVMTTKYNLLSNQLNNYPF
jgi:hypothetical protein